MNFNLNIIFIYIINKDIIKMDNTYQQHNQLVFCNCIKCVSFRKQRKEKKMAELRKTKNAKNAIESMNAFMNNLQPKDKQFM